MNLLPVAVSRFMHIIRKPLGIAAVVVIVAGAIAPATNG